MNKYDTLKIGALLHDIGKLLERGGYRGNVELYSGSYGHEKSGSRFFEEYFDKFGFNFSNEEKSIIKQIIGMHHCKNINNNEWHVNIVKLADWLSSGERITSEQPIEQKREEQPLYSIFESILLQDNDKKSIDYNKAKKYNLIELNVSNNIFPKNGYPNRYYKNLINEFLEEVNKNIDNFEKLYQLMQKYTWCVPSATYWKRVSPYLPDVSLFDHSKTTCAIACCLYKLCKNEKINNEYIKNLLKNLINETNKIKEIKEKYKENEKDKSEKINKIKELLNNDIKYSNKNIFSLIHGDISGVQNFIFNITSKGANKSLKGRSFYLDFLTELCAKYVVKELNLPIANILFYGGGHFYILSHNVNNEEIKHFEEKINNILFDKFGADLYVAIGKVDLRPIDFLIDCADKDVKIGIPYKWKESAEAISKRKMKKFEYKGMELFEPKGSGNEKNRCNVCKAEKDKIYQLDDGTKICENCASFVEITNFLKKFEKENSIDYNLNSYSNIFKKTKYFNKLPVLMEFFNLIEFENALYNLPDADGNLKIPYKLGSIAFPVDDNNGIKDFSKLGEDAEKRTGTNKIGILKMDVDNLGKIITRGLGNRATISRLSTLSSMLTLFFTGYIPYLIKSNEKYKNSIYLTYSGGDDTLIVGAWDRVWDLAKEINEKFREFVCDNSDITLSAGIVLVNPKFEYRKGVYLAEDELENAKENIIEINGKKLEKDSVSIFELPLKWNSIKDVNNYEEKFIKAMKNTDKRRIVHLVQKTSSNLKKAFGKNVSKDEFRINVPYLWRMKYYLYRNYSNKDGGLDENVKFIDNYLTKIESKIKEGDTDGLKNFNFNDMIIASRIAELKSRNKGCL
ncbi:type III-A CRISPR-associated protein Cas10/Csm1 [Methanothermococcus sp.]|uniref:type III-A CRISPR-associated protein Cas10/Csm1 n=1 Tax=Methanothermococcus sp. TaxID=2614238 RepID=UPI0025D04069|nr:type III-A CRISPR-associated protein Cas10/Csm1 [Methanothermococcus sp.]